MLNMKNINDRLKELYDFKGFKSYSEFAEITGLGHQTASNYIKGKQKPDIDRLNAIIQSFDDVSIDWLVTGKGEMIKSDNINTSQIASNNQGVPYYENIEVAGGIIPMYSDYKEIPSFYINYEHFNDCTAYLPVVGDSMYPNYCSGEIIAVKEILNLDVIQWGESYFIVTNSLENDLKTIKQVHCHEDHSKLILRASNPNFKGDTVVRKENILKMYIIKGKIKRNQL